MDACKQVHRDLPDYFTYEITCIVNMTYIYLCCWQPWPFL